MNESILYLGSSGLGAIVGSALRMAPRSAVAAAALNLISAIGWYLGASGAT